MLRWEWGNKDVHLVTTFVFCHVSKCFYFWTRVSLWKRVRKMPKSGTGHAYAIGFRGHIHVMHWNNSSLQFGNKMAKLSYIDSYHETLIHIANHGFACSICAQIIQRILWCYNGFCDFHWNHIQRILCSSCAIRLSAMDIRDDLTQISHWIGQNLGVRNITYKDFKKFECLIFVSFSVFLITVLFKCNTLHVVDVVWTRSYYIEHPWFELSSQISPSVGC